MYALTPGGHLLPHIRQAVEYGQTAEAERLREEYVAAQPEDERPGARELVDTLMAISAITAAHTGTTSTDPVEVAAVADRLPDHLSGEHLDIILAVLVLHSPRLKGSGLAAFRDLADQVRQSLPHLSQTLHEAIDAEQRRRDAEAEGAR